MKHQLSDKAIERMKDNYIYTLSGEFPYNKRPYTPAHGRNDRIRIAYEWLDAQKKITKPSKNHTPIKHMIEAWCGDYISRDDVEIAAALHNDIVGKYPHFNLSANLVLPSKKRLSNIILMKEGYVNTYAESYKSVEA